MAQHPPSPAEIHNLLKNARRYVSLVLEYESEVNSADSQNLRHKFYVKANEDASELVACEKQIDGWLSDWGREMDEDTQKQLLQERDSARDVLNSHFVWSQYVHELDTNEVSNDVQNTVAEVHLENSGSLFRILLRHVQEENPGSLTQTLLRHISAHQDQYWHVILVAIILGILMAITKAVLISLTLCFIGLILYTIFFI